jgi:riboflavin synthase
VCHTVVAKSAESFEVDTSRATLDVTSGLAQGRDVNLEKSLRLGDRIDGHLVSGHVDGVGTVTAFDELAAARASRSTRRPRSRATSHARARSRSTA